ncbi:hypothetical protein ACFX2C_031887 [Malus domestica]
MSIGYRVLPSEVNVQYVWNKLKGVQFPFLYKGHRNEITEPVGGRFSPEALNWLLIRGLLGCFVICNAESDIASSGYHCWTLWHMQGIIRRVVLACIWTGSVELLILFFMPWTCLFMRGSLLGEDCEGRTLSRESTLER